jgi:hypothetical protein
MYVDSFLSSLPWYHYHKQSFWIFSQNLVSQMPNREAGTVTCLGSTVRKQEQSEPASLLLPVPLRKHSATLTLRFQVSGGRRRVYRKLSADSLICGPCSDPYRMYRRMVTTSYHRCPQGDGSLCSRRVSKRILWQMALQNPKMLCRKARIMTSCGWLVTGPTFYNAIGMLSRLTTAYNKRLASN